MPLWQSLVNMNMPGRSKVAQKKKPASESIHDRDRIIVRLPDGMRDELAALAETNGRSMTSEVVAAIEKHLRGADRLTQLWEFFERQRQHIEEIPFLSAAVENLEAFAERAGDFQGSLRERWRRERGAASLASIMSVVFAGEPITAEQAQQIRSLLSETGKSEASLLKELNASSLESINGLVFKRALSILEVWRRANKDQSA
jgi:predicted DNA-binding protein